MPFFSQESKARPWILQLEVTNDCNQNCSICMRRTSTRRVGYLEIENFKKLPISEFKEISFHGWGEPFLHPKLFEMIDYAASYGVKTSLITNGTLLDKRLDELLESKLNSIAFGIFSLNGKARVLESIKKLVEGKNRRGLNLEVWIDITITGWNTSEIPNIVRFAGKAGVDGVVLHRLFTLHDPSLRKPSLIDEVESCRLAKKAGRESGVKVYCPPRSTRPCRVALMTMFISWDCMVSPCCFLCEMNYYTCNALDKSFNEILELHRKFLREMKKNEICRRCPW